MYDLTSGAETFCEGCGLRLTIAKDGDAPYFDCADELNCPQSAEIRYAEAVRLKDAAWQRVQLATNPYQHRDEGALEKYRAANTEYDRLVDLADTLLPARCAEQNARLGSKPTAEPLDPDTSPGGYDYEREEAGHWVQDCERGVL